MIRMMAYFLAALLFSCGPASAQNLANEDSRAVSLYGDAQQHLRDKEYPAAVETLQNLVNGFAKSPYCDLYLYSLGRACYLAGDFQKAAMTMEQLSQSFPLSYLMPYASYLRANADYRLGRLASACLSYGQAYGTTTDERLKQLGRQSLLAAVEAGYFPADSILNQLPADLLCPVKGRMASLRSGQWDQKKVAAFMGDCPREMNRRDQSASTTADRLTIGLVVPLTGPYAKYGRAILDGAMLAAEQLAREQLPIDMPVYDTKADNVTAARAALSLAESGVDLIIGPLLSDVAATTAAALACYHMPLLVPAATQAGFTDLSPACFQLSPNMITIGRGMAQYAVSRRGLKKLAVMTPSTVDEQTMAEAFVAEATRLGAEIVAIERYRPGETDFTPYIKDLKDTLLKTVGDSTIYLTLEGDSLDRYLAPVSLDAIFIPANENELTLLLPQLDYFQVRAIYLGTDTWDNDQILKLGPRVLGQAVFYSARAAMRQSAGFEAFAALYTARFGAAPDHLAALGYDAVSMAASGYRLGRVGPGYLGEFLGSLKGYDGVSGRITFGKVRTNLELPLFSYQNGRVIRESDWSKVKEWPRETIPTDSTGAEYYKFE